MSKLKRYLDASTGVLRTNLNEDEWEAAMKLITKRSKRMAPYFYIRRKLTAFLWHLYKKNYSIIKMMLFKLKLRKEFY